MWIARYIYMGKPSASQFGVEEEIRTVPTFVGTYVGTCLAVS